MNKKSLIIAAVADLVLIGLIYLVLPNYLGQVVGFIRGFLGTSEQLTFIILFAILFYPIWRAAKKILG